MEIKLTQAEAVVLEELLQRISRNEALYEDAAEQYVIWRSWKKSWQSRIRPTICSCWHKPV